MSWDEQGAYFDFGPIARQIADAQAAPGTPEDEVARVAHELGRCLAQATAVFFGGEVFDPSRPR